MVMDIVSEKKKLYFALALQMAIEKLTKEFQENSNQLNKEEVEKNVY
jgi:hypothetical protein